MPRRPRLQFKGSIHHVMARGNRRSKIFRCDDDCLHFFEVLGAARERFNVRWRAVTLMKTHYHLKVECPDGNLSAAMQYVNGVFTQTWNRRHRRTGHVFEGRFVSTLVEDGRYAHNVLRYIALNPVEAGYVEHAAEWPWGSHRALAGFVSPPEFLDLDWMRLYFDGPTLAARQRQYRDFIDLEEHRLENIGDRVVLGSEHFRSNVRELVGVNYHQLRVPRTYRALARRSLPELFAGIFDDLERRNQMVIRAQVVHGYTQSEIAKVLNVHPNTISKITRAIKHQRYFVVRLRP